MAKILENKYNIISRKTYDLHFRFPFENIPSKFHRDIIRGFLDGDGCVQKYFISFVFNSITFLNQIVDIFKDLFQKNPLIPSMLYNIETVDGKTTKY
jgi:intein-encoded DNA endonuclease-like protein